MKKILPTKEEMLFLVKSLILWIIMFWVLWPAIGASSYKGHYKQADKYLREMKKPEGERKNARANTDHIAARVEQENDKRNLTLILALLLSQSVLWRFSKSNEEDEPERKGLGLRDALLDPGQKKKLEPKKTPKLPLEEFPKSDADHKGEV